jgi:hypothetical protein
MSKQSINIGTFPNDGTGDSIRTGMDKVNTNFTEIYDALGDGEDIRDISVSTSLASGGGSLTYSNRTLNYTPPNLSAYLTSLGSIGEHSDVSISNPELNEVLKWDGSSWVNGVLDIASTDYVDNAVTGLATTEYVDTAVSGVTTFSGNYTDLTNKPTIPSIVGLASEGYVDTAVSGVTTFSGNYTDLTNKPTIPLNINDLSDVNAGSPSTGQVLKWSGTEWNASSDLAGDGGTGIGLSDISLTVNSAGVSSLTYNDTTGVFTFTPTSLTGLATTEYVDTAVSGLATTEYVDTAVSGLATTEYVDTAVSGLATTEYVDTAVSGVTTFSGNYTDLTNKPTIPLNINDLSDVNAGSPSTGQVLKWSGTEWSASSDLTGEGGTGIGLSDISLTVNSAGVSSLTYNDTTGVFTFTPTSLTGLATTEYVDNAVIGLATTEYVDNAVTGLATTEYVDNAVTRSRSSATSSTDPIGVGSTATIRIVNTPRTYVLYSIQTEYPAWVTLYTDTNSRTNDASRNETTDPLPGSGVIAEVITTTNNLTQLITPGTIGFNNQPTPHPEIYLRVVNKHDSEVSIAVTVKYLKLED